MIKLAVIILISLAVGIFYLILKDSMHECYIAHRDSREYDRAISYLDRHYRHCGYVASPAEVWLMERVQKKVAIEAYEDYMRGRP